jgi:hypothetical protein
MLGKREPQRSFFDALGLPHRVAPDSFYGRMGSLEAQLFSDEDLKEMYCDDNGRPSLPPSLLSGVLLLQFYDDVSDAEAVERVLFDLRWKVALNISLDYNGFHSSSLSVFRARLVEHKQERYAFDQLLKVSRQAGLLADKVTLLTDTTDVKGAGAVQDTYTLLRKGIRKLLKTMGYNLPGKRQGCSTEIERLISTYVDQDRRAEADWSDPAARQEQLKILVADSEAALELALTQTEDPEVRSLGWMIAKILGDDVETGAGGELQIAEGAAADRVISLEDPEMRHGRKSAAHKFNGHKTSTCIDQASELILDIADIPASDGDGNALMPSIARVEEHAGVTVECAIGDGAYGSGKNRAACAERPEKPIDLLSPMRHPTDPEVDKSAFKIDLEAQTATCPHGQTVSASSSKTDDEGRITHKFIFDRANCLTCPLFARCVRSQTTGRTLTTSPYEAYLRAARERQRTDEFKQRYRLRSRVEGKQAELVAHGLRNTRYLGAAKRSLQRLYLGAAINLKRITTLAESKGIDLRAILTQLPKQQSQVILEASCPC